MIAMNLKIRIILTGFVFLLFSNCVLCQKIEVFIDKACVRNNNLDVSIIINNKTNNLYSLNNFFSSQKNIKEENKIFIIEKDSVVNIPKLNFYKEKIIKKTKWLVKPNSSKNIKISIYKFINKNEAGGIYLILNTTEIYNKYLKLDLALKKEDNSVESISTNLVKIEYCN